MTTPGGFHAAHIEPTREQLDIQHADQPSIIVQANAGAAKTTTLALRIGAALARGCAPERVLALTYTAPACQALLAAMKKVGIPGELVRRVPVRTFDAFAAEVLLGVEREPVPFKARAEALAPSVWQALEALDLSADDTIVERFLAAARRIKGTLARDRMRWDGIRLSADTAEDLGVEFDLLRLFDAYESIRAPRTDGSDRPRFRAVFDATYDLACLLADPESPTPLAEIVQLAAPGRAAAGRRDARPEPGDVHGAGGVVAQRRRPASAASATSTRWCTARPAPRRGSWTPDVEPRQRPARGPLSADRDAALRQAAGEGGRACWRTRTMPPRAATRPRWCAGAIRRRGCRGAGDRRGAGVERPGRRRAWPTWRCCCGGRASRC